MPQLRQDWTLEKGLLAGWWRLCQQGAAAPGGKPNKISGGGKKGGKVGKSVSGLEPHQAQAEPQAEPAEMGFLNLSGLERADEMSSETDASAPGFAPREPRGEW